MIRETLNNLSNYLYNAKEVVISRLSNRKGMEMLQMVIIIGIALVLGVLVYTFIDTAMGSANNSNSVLGKIQQKLNNVMNAM